jgi:hypothetical protein
MDDTDEVAQVRMPADVHAPDKVLYGLTFRQLAILAVAAVVLFGAWRILHRLLPAPLLLAAGLVAAGAAIAIVVGRRDGQPLDVWLTHAVRFSRSPRALSTLHTAAALPTWVQPPRGRPVLPAPLRLPAAAITDSGEINLPPSGHAALVAAGTVNLALRTGTEQQALVDAFGRWLNALSGPTQILVSAQPDDLTGRADQLASSADRLPHPALAAACRDHAAFLTELASTRDPLHRQVVIVGRDTTAGQARRRADDTTRTLSALPIAVRVLDGDTTLAALAGSADPYQPTHPTTASADTTITAAMAHQSPIRAGGGR